MNLNREHEPGIEPSTAHAALLAELSLIGLAADQCEAVVIVGAVDNATSEALQLALPNLPVLVIGLRGHEQGALATLAAKRIAFATTVEPSESYNSDAYLELVEFITATGVTPGRTLIYLDAGVRAADPVAFDAIHATAIDLTLCHSRRWLDCVEPNLLPVDWMLGWANHLAEKGEAFHALKFYYAVKGRIDRRTIAVTVMRALIALNCMALVPEWIPFLSEDEAERDQVRSALEEEVAVVAEAGADRMRENMDALKDHHPIAFTELERRRPSETFHVAIVAEVPWLVQLAPPRRVQRGTYAMLFRIDAAGRIRELNGCPTPRVAADAIAGCVHDVWKGQATVIGTFDCYGLTVGLLGNELKASVPNLRRAVYIVERDPAVLLALFRTMSFTDTIADPAAQWFVGPAAIDELIQFLDERPLRPIPAGRLRIDSEIARRLDILSEMRASEERWLSGQVARIYSGDHHVDFHAALTGRAERKPRLLFVTSLFTSVLQYCSRDLARAFAELGVETLLIKENEGAEQMNRSGVLRELVRFKPDAVVLLDHVRQILPAALPEQVPVVTWIQDDLDHLVAPERIRSVAAGDLVYAICRDFVTKFTAAGYRDVRPLTFAANSALYTPLANPGVPRDEVAFITHMNPLLDPPGCTGLFAWMAARLAKRGIGYQRVEYYTALLDEAEAALGVTVPAARRAATIDTARLLLERQVHRTEVVRWLVRAEIPVALYGDGWQAFPEFAPYARGSLASGDPLRRAYQQHKVVLHVNNHLNTHTRVFEAMAAGGFVVARTHPRDAEPGELHSALVPGAEIAMFSTAAELEALVRRAFADEAWRAEMIAAGRRRVLAEHTYVHRARTILTDLIQVTTARSAQPALPGGC